MTDYLLYAILGLGSGAVIGFISLGILIGFRGSGVVNFAQGGLGMYVAYVFYSLRTTGEYLQPLPGLPGFIRVGPSDGLGTAPSLAIAVVTSVLLGLVMHLAVFRPLRAAPTLAKVVASIGLMLALQSIVAYRYGTNNRAGVRVLPEATAFELDGIRFPVDRFIVAGCLVAAAAVMIVLFRHTRFGLATRAAAENERAAMFLGYSPELQAGASWVLASVLAGIGGILVAPMTTLTPTGFSLLVVPALGACLVARFSSYSVAVGAAFGIGIAQNVLANMATRIKWLPSVGLPEAVPFVLIIVMMVVAGKSLPERGQAVEGRLQSVAPTRRRVVLPIVLFAAGVLAFLQVSSAYRLALANTFIGAILCLSLVVITGYVAQISLFQITLAGVAAYSLAGLSTAWGVPFPIGPLLAAVVATGVGLVAALPSLRVRGINLAVVTLAAGWAIEELIFKNPDYNGGVSGASVEPANFLGLDLAFSVGRTIAQPAFGIMVMAVFTALALVVTNLRRSATGRTLLALRTNERAAAAMGIDVARNKLFAFALAAFIAGIAGTLRAYQQTHLSNSSFTVLVSVSVLAIAFLGGITSVGGALAGGLLISGGLFTHVFDDLVFSRSSNGVALQDLIAGMALIVTAILNPQGIAGAMRHTGRQLRDLWRRVARSGVGGVAAGGGAAPALAVDGGVASVADRSAAPRARARTEVSR